MTAWRRIIVHMDMVGEFRRTEGWHSLSPVVAMGILGIWDLVFGDRRRKSKGKRERGHPKSNEKPNEKGIHVGRSIAASGTCYVLST